MRMSAIGTKRTSWRAWHLSPWGMHLSPLALCCRFQRGCSVFNCMKVAAVFAPKKVYGCSSSEAFNCVHKFQCAATTRARPTSNFCRVHAVLQEGSTQYSQLQIKNRLAPEGCFVGTKFWRLLPKGGGTQRPSQVDFVTTVPSKAHTVPPKGCQKGDTAVSQ